MSRTMGVITVAVAAWLGQAQGNLPYACDFDTAEVGKVPADMLVLDGGFAVRAEGTNRFLELPGAPLESYGILMGPAQKENVCVAARIHGTSHGRRFPTFAVGLNGVGGYRLQVSPGKRELELLKGDVDRASVPFTWQGGEWTHLKLQVRKTADQVWRVEGKAWVAGTAEPADWTVTTEEREEPKPGRAGLYASPFAGTPVRFDDVIVRAIDAH